MKKWLRKMAVVAVVAAMLIPVLMFYLAHFTDRNGMAPMLCTERNFAAADMPDLGGRLAVVTGANAGLGFSTAKALAGAGATTVLACRSQTKCQAAVDRIIAAHPGARVEARALDLSSLASVRAFADGLLGGGDGAGGAAVDKLDMLVLNAGVMAPPYTLTTDGLELQFGVNHVAHAYLALKLLPLVRKAAAATPDSSATVTVVSSAAHSRSIKGPGPAGERGVHLDEVALNAEANYGRASYYGQSKLANVLFSAELSRRLGDGAQRVYVNSVHPGMVATELGRHLQDALQNYLPAAVVSAVLHGVMSLVWTSDEAALTQLYAACSPDVPAQGLSGKYLHPIAKVHPPSPKAQDADTQARLWAFTAEILALRGFSDYEPV